MQNSGEPICVVTKWNFLLYDNSSSVHRIHPKGEDMSHNRDKEKKENKKKAQHNLKEKRKLRKEKKLPKNSIALTKHS